MTVQRTDDTHTLWHRLALLVAIVLLAVTMTADRADGHQATAAEGGCKRGNSTIIHPIYVEVTDLGRTTVREGDHMVTRQYQGHKHYLDRWAGIVPNKNGDTYFHINTAVCSRVWAPVRPARPCTMCQSR